MVAALFFVPAGLVIAELGVAFPNQGGPYVWVRLAFGRYAGSLVALVYFLETPVWVGGSLAITCVAVADRLILPLEGGWRVPVALAFVWTTVTLAVAPLRAGKRVPLAGALAASALATGWSAVGLAAALWPGLGTGDPDAHLPDGFAGQRLAFTLAELVPLAAVVVAAVLLVRSRPVPARMTALEAAVEAPFARAARDFLARGDAHFSIPGHKRNPALVGDQPALLADMPTCAGSSTSGRPATCSGRPSGSPPGPGGRTGPGSRSPGRPWPTRPCAWPWPPPATGWWWPGPPTARSWPGWCWPGSTRSGSRPRSTRRPGWPWPSRPSGSSAPSATTPTPGR